MRRSSVSKRSAASPADMRFEGTWCQHRSIIYHSRSGISRLLGRGGLAPLSMECAAATPAISEKGGRPVRTCLESANRTVIYGEVHPYLPDHSPEIIYVAGLCGACGVRQLRRHP